MQPTYFAVIPASVRYDKDLPPNAKLLYGEITALANREGYCFASNQYFAELYDVDKTRISKWISALQKKGYVRVEINQDTFQRHIRIPATPLFEAQDPCPKGQAPPLSKKTIGVDEKDNTPCPKGQYNNTVNTIDDDVEGETPISETLNEVLLQHQTTLLADKEWVHNCARSLSITDKQYHDYVSRFIARQMAEKRESCRVYSECKRWCYNWIQNKMTIDGPPGEKKGHKAQVYAGVLQNQTTQPNRIRQEVPD
ncbi:helix-turn-helix domain-containing protein [Larkinella ripae]